MSEKGDERNGKGQFKTGRSGNPKGRPPGSGLAGELRAMLEARSSELVEKAVELALEGDTTALRMCLERVVPPLKAKDMAVSIEGLEGSLTEQGSTVIQAAGRGELTPAEAASFLQALAAQSKVTEIDDLERRIAALESRSAR